RDRFDDRGDTAALLADAVRLGALQLDLRRSVGAVSELVLQTLDEKRVAAPVVEDAGQEKAGEPARRVREPEERVAHRRRAEPLPSVERIAGAVDWLGTRLVRSHVGAALLLGERHAREHARLLT